MTTNRSRPRSIPIWNRSIKSILRNAAFVLAELVLKGIVVAVLAIPVMIALAVAGLLSVLNLVVAVLLSILAQSMALARAGAGVRLGETGFRAILLLAQI
jgi:hypothetical protein